MITNQLILTLDVGSPAFAAVHEAMQQWLDNTAIDDGTISPATDYMRDAAEKIVIDLDAARAALAGVA